MVLVGDSIRDNTVYTASMSLLALLALLSVLYYTATVVIALVLLDRQWYGTYNSTGLVECTLPSITHLQPDAGQVISHTLPSQPIHYLHLDLPITFG